MHSPTDMTVSEFEKHQDVVLPFTAPHLGRRNLDIGCGNGITSVVHQNRLGIEPTLCDVIDIRHKIAGELPFFLIKNVLPFADKSFDSAYFQYVLHHAPTESVSSLLSEAARVARKIVIVEETVGPRTDTATASAFDEEINEKLHTGVLMPVYHYFTLKEIKDLLVSVGFKNVTHALISPGDERGGYLETYCIVAES